jgi:hypothetical protein
MRFALMEVKLGIAKVVRHFTIAPSPKTLIPMVFSGAKSLSPKGGMWLAIIKRTNID